MTVKCLSVHISKCAYLTSMDGLLLIISFHFSSLILCPKVVYVCMPVSVVFKLATSLRH